MLEDDGKPMIGSESKMLGVRVAPNPNADIPVDGNGDVQPLTGGMSVAPAWRNLPLHLISRRLQRFVPRARGHDDLVCWRLGQGEFKGADVSADLVLRPDPSKPNEHGFVEPSQVMTAAAYQGALAATRDTWVRDES
jgi:hypothetical protein